MAEKQIITDSVIEKSSELPNVQYWWLNNSSEIWDIEDCKIGDEYTLLSYNIKFGGRNLKGLDIDFINWLDCYLVNKKDNPRIGIPISQREMAISFLDYCGIKVDEKGLKKEAFPRINELLPMYIKESPYVMNPEIVLLSKTDIKEGLRHCAAWQYPKNPDGSIRTDKDGNRRPRELSAPYPRCYYFYRKTDIPHYSYDKRHIGNKDYVQPAPGKDPEIGYPDIKSITPLRRTTSTNVHQGDTVIVCEPTTKQITGLLKIVNVRSDKITMQIKEIYEEPVSIDNIDGNEYFPKDLDRLILLDNKEYNNIRKEIILNNPEYGNRRYSRDDLLKTAFIDESLLDDVDQTLREKKCVILQGAPGVGKTYLAKRIAYARMGLKDDSRIEYVQFHPNYTYEDFVIGYKPREESQQFAGKKNNGGFILKDGVFKAFCKKAKMPSNSKKEHYFIIDEINRGNISKIFGEAFSLIEKSYRNQRIKLAYSQKTFKIPKNVYIIGLMNTADRSLAMIDFALRRRFRFITLKPAFLSDSFRKYQKEINNKTFDKVIEGIVVLNETITKDQSLGEGFCIGHSYFCLKPKDVNKEILKRIIEYEIIPMLQEYWFDNEGKFKEEVHKLRDTLK